MALYRNIAGVSYSQMQDMGFIGAATSAPINQTIWLRGNNGLYVSSENGERNMTCNRPEVHEWEQFTVIDTGGGKVSLRSMDKYVSSENGETPMTCNRLVPLEWEQFDWIGNDDGTVTLRGNNGLYVSSENGERDMTCDRIEVHEWEKFSYGVVAAATVIPVTTPGQTNVPGTGQVPALPARGTDYVTLIALGGIIFTMVKGDTLFERSRKLVLLGSVAALYYQLSRTR